LLSAQKSEDDGLQKEWDAARDVLKAFDDRIDALRRNGFSFVTALLAAQSLLIPYVAGSTGNSSSLPDNVKFVIVSVTMLLVFTLKLIEGGYQSFERAATTRALVIEKKLNIELTEIIDLRFRKDHIRLWMTLVYVLFIIGALLVGWFSIIDPYWKNLLILSTTMAIIGTVALNWVFNLKFPYGEEDWTIEKLECGLNDEVGITMTNLSGHRVIELNEEDLLWEIRPEGYDRPVHIEKAKVHSVIPPKACFTWSWKVKSEEGCLPVVPGVYWVFPTQSKRDGRERYRDYRRLGEAPLTNVKNKLLRRKVKGIPMPLPRAVRVVDTSKTEPAMDNTKAQVQTN